MACTRSSAGRASPVSRLKRSRAEVWPRCRSIASASEAVSSRSKRAAVPSSFASARRAFSARSSEIVSTTKRFYALKTAPRVDVGDRCILYRSGKCRGFIGVFEFLSVPVPASVKLGDSRTFSFKLPWKAVALCEESPLSIVPLINELRFIKNKGHYSMALRTAFRSLDRADYDFYKSSIKPALALDNLLSLIGQLHIWMA